MVQYFSMEFIDGETVKDVIERQGAVDLATVGKVMSAMAEALSFAEAHKIVHRDIKPDNIMLTASGVVKLADLGLALQADSAEAVAGSKDEQGRGKVMGTPLYIAPEQARAQPIDHRADQYALGATLYHMLTGRPPFQGENAKAIMRAHCFDPVPDPAEVNPQVPPLWGEMCRRMMAKAPEERFPHAADLRTAIKAAMRWKPGALQRSTAKTSKPPWLAITVVSAIAVGALWWFGLRAPTAPSVQPPPATEQPHSGTAATSGQVGNPARDQVVKLLASLPEDPAPALAELERLLTKTELAPGKDLLLERRTRVRAVIEERRREALRSALATVEGKIAAGRLGEAELGLSRLPQEAWLANQRAVAAEHLTAANQAQENRFIGAIAAAGDTAACDQLAGELTRVDLSEKLHASLTERLAQRRQTLAQQSAKAVHVDIVARWRELGDRSEPLRGTLPFTALADLFRSSAPSFPEGERKHLEQLVTVVELAQQAEDMLRLYVLQEAPTVECRFGNRSGSFQLIKLDKDSISFRLADAAVETRAVRATAVVPWTYVMGLATAGKPDSQRLTAAFLWFWHQEDARAALAKLKGDALATAIAVYEQRTRPLTIAGDLGRTNGGLVSVAYPFAAKRDPRFLTAWDGRGAELNERGLVWKATATIEPSNRNEADLPSLRWKSSLQLPIVLEALVQPEPDSDVTLIGLASADYTVRVGFNSKNRCFYLATKTDGSGEYAPEGSVLDRDPNTWSRIRLMVDASGKVSATLNDKALTSERPLAFKPNARLWPVIQARPTTRNSGLAISSITVTGKP